MDGSTGEGRKAYSAFISYSFADRAFAERLQRRLETYRFPKRVAASTGMARLPPVFRDRTELVAAPDLSQSIRDALDASACLIVVCSPDAAQSEWVKYEIEYFSRSRARPCVWAAIARGDPASAFPPALIIAAGGANPLAADFRPERDGERLALLKLIAAMAGVGLDDLVRRDTQRRITRLKWSAAAAIAATGATASVAVVTLQARATAAAEQARCEEVVSFYLGEGRRKAETTGRLDVLRAMSRTVENCFNGRTFASMKPKHRLQLASFLHAEASDNEKRGKLSQARKQVDQAHFLTASILRQRPNDVDVIFAHAQSDYFSGLIAWRQRDVARARRDFENYAARTTLLNRKQPTNTLYLEEVAYSNSNLGLLLLRETIYLKAAHHHYLTAQQKFEEIASKRPGDKNIIFQIADGYSYLAEISRLSLDYRSAGLSRIRQRSLIKHLLGADPRNATYRSALLVSHIGMARLHDEQRRLKEATTEWHNANQLADELSTLDPENLNLKRQVRAISLFRVRNWLIIENVSRPSISSLKKIVGDCVSDSINENGQDIAILCKLQQARIAIKQGKNQNATQILKSIADDATINHRSVNAVWRRDLQSETSQINEILQSPA